jgi:putative Mg2+ transporter-C (MgtC) family protein
MSRVIQGIMTGVGFVGAGVIMRNATGDKIQGLTTAAAVWITAALGAICGIGEWKITVSLSIIVPIVLLTAGPLERWSLPSRPSQESQDRAVADTNSPARKPAMQRTQPACGLLIAP